jgi:hypothetical protein
MKGLIDWAGHGRSLQIHSDDWRCPGDFVSIIALWPLGCLPSTAELTESIGGMCDLLNNSRSH